ncbi:MAG: MBL fold metallo-hydrolase [Cellvibrionaceae bacterium]|nr:MBL fold metallo-hydrolase [Cellvibrionaceae bacterium]
MNISSKTATVLYRKNGHSCIVFSDLVEGEGVQANQFLIIDENHTGIIDPGGDLTYTPLSIEISKHVNLQDLDYIFASHQDPDIIASLPRWMLHSDCKVVTPAQWSRFLPHLASSFVTDKLKHVMNERIIAVPDKGMKIPFGRSHIIALPAHFLHSVGNINFYDPVSKILFSGDMGASMVDENPEAPVEDFAAHIPLMEGFHQRYMTCNKACRLWAKMVSQLDVQMIIPQHGRPFIGRTMIAHFLKWIANLECGVDLLSESDYQIIE